LRVEPRNLKPNYIPVYKPSQVFLNSKYLVYRKYVVVQHSTYLSHISVLTLGNVISVIRSSVALEGPE